MEIKAKAESWCVAFAEVEEIDTINIYWAGIQAMQRAVRGLGSTPQHLLIDAKRLKERHPAACHHQGRRQVRQHRCRLHPRKSRARRGYADA
ncbi:hypothetical protein QRQ56_30725 [Bradyrhizobium sp. U531]|uniref:hypothetical protein n=1 Tax=Bradyrhizobium sp. U531 TaxID=3053458 RepID=UPI003F428A8B